MLSFHISPLALADGIWNIFMKQSLRSGTNSPIFPPGHLPRSTWAGNNMTSFGQLIYPKGRHWGQRFFPRSENKFSEAGRWSGCVVHDSPPGIRSSHKCFTHRQHPHESKEQLWLKKNIAFSIFWE